MSVLKIFKFPDPILKKVCSKVTKFDLKLEGFVNDLTETLQSYKFCVGIAAPQAGSLQRVIIVDVSRARKPQPNNGLLILINPVILESSNFKIVREGCLSIPDFTANVKRAMEITIAYQNIKGETKTLSTKDFEAHAIQHEADHLDGILFLDKITSPAADLFRRVKY
ncbi:MAG: peptide deformylase [Candidatus Melainabacteria bacterium]|nr:peptide deformylase [Candidatus Melainabacteria bacterium]